MASTPKTQWKELLWLPLLPKNELTSNTLIPLLMSPDINFNQNFAHILTLYSLFTHSLLTPYSLISCLFLE